MDRRLLLAGLSVTVLLAGCGESPEPPPAADKVRPETRNIEAAAAVGYNGSAVRKQLDAVLDKNDQHNDQLKQEVERQNKE